MSVRKFCQARERELTGTCLQIRNERMRIWLPNRSERIPVFLTHFLTAEKISHFLCAMSLPAFQKWLWKIRVVAGTCRLSELCLMFFTTDGYDMDVRDPNMSVTRATCSEILF